MQTRLSLSLLATLAVTAAVALALGVGNAAAGKYPAGAACSHTTVQPFLPWLDLGSYFLAPGGDFESKLTGWTTTGGAQIVSGNESYFVTSRADTHSLSLPAGSSATSPSMCVSLDSPDLRLFVRNTGSLLSTVNVTVNYTDALGKARSLLVAPVLGGSAWSPSLPLLFLQGITSILSSNGQTTVSFTFTPVGSAGHWQVDDFYVDPIKHV